MLGEDSQVEGLWRQQSIWPQAANRMKASIGRARFAVLALTVGGTALATLAARLPAGQTSVGSVLTTYRRGQKPTHTTKNHTTIGVSLDRQNGDHHGSAAPTVPGISSATRVCGDRARPSAVARSWSPSP